MRAPLKKQSTPAASAKIFHFVQNDKGRVLALAGFIRYRVYPLTNKLTANL